METRTLVATAVALAFVGVALAPMAMAGHESDDREAGYVNQSGAEHELNQICADAMQAVGVGESCPQTIPTGIMWTSCDHVDGLFGAGVPFNGIGGTLHCNVAMGQALTAEIDEAVLDGLAAVTCYFESEPGANWYHSVDPDEAANADPTWSGDIPDDGHCSPFSSDVNDDHPATGECEANPEQECNDNTRIGMFVRGPPNGGATTGTNTLTFG